MDATQQIDDSFFREEDDSDGEDEKGEGKTQREPLAVLKVFKNNHIPETEVPLYQGENVLGRDPASCSVPLLARSISSCHAIISISVFGPNDRRAHNEATEALLWDLGSLNGTRKGRLKLTPHVRYALTDRDSVVLADLPCQYVNLKNTERDTHTSGADCEKEKEKGSGSTSSSSDGETGKGVENGGKKSALPPVSVWSDEGKSLEALQTSPRRPEKTLVPASDSDSDGENGRRERKRIVVSDSASSDLSSPMCSTFLTPANKIIPESEDESSITPSPALKGSFLKTGNDTNVSSDSSKPDPLHFNIDSDTDVEDEEVEQTKATSGIEAAVTAEVKAVNPADLHMDSDTDVEDEEVDKAEGDSEPSEAPAKQDPVNPSTLIMDSDTDAEENGPEAAVEEKKEPTSSAQLHMESDTDVEDEDVPDIQDSRPPTSHVGEFNIDSDTDVEEGEEATKAIQTPSGSKMVTADLVKQTSLEVPDDKTVHHQSDSDTDAEVGERSTGPQHDEPVEVRPPAETVRDEFRLDSDTDVEEEDEKNEGKCAEAAGQIVHSSTPRGAGLSEEEMETQVFLSPSQPFKRPGLPSLLHPSISPGGVSHSDDDFAVAETQSFVCDAAQADATLDETPQSLDDPESRQTDGASSFQLGLSDSSHKLPETEEHDGEPAEEDWQLQETQLYAMKHSEGSTKAGQTQPDLDATQAYVDFIGREEEEDGEEEEKEEEEEKTQPLAALGHSNIQTVETQLIKHEAQDEENGDHGANKEAVASEPKKKAGEDVDEEMQADSHLSTADTLLIIRSPRQEDQPRPYAFLSAENLKEQEEAASEGEKAQDERVQPENDDDEGRERKKNDLTRDEPNEEKKERDKDEGVERGNETTEAGTLPAETDTIVETQPMCEEDEANEEEQLNEPSSSRGTPPAKVESTQPLESDVHTHVGIPETQPMCEEEERQEEEEQKPRNSTRPAGRRRTAKAEPKSDNAESDNATPVTVAETQPMCEEDEAHEEEQLNEPSSSKGTPPAKVESTQPLESDVHTHVGIPETQPTCEEEERQEEEEQKPRNSTRPGRRRRTAKAEPKSDKAESDNVTHVTVAETQPMCEEDNEVQGEEQQSEVVSTKRSSTRRHVAKTKLVESHVTIPETLPMCEEEEGQNESKPGRKSRRGRQTVKTEPTQPLESDCTAETVVEEEEEEQDSRRSLRGNKGGRATSGKGKGKGRAAAARGRRGQVEQEEDSEEETDQGGKGRGRKNLRQASKEELVEAENEGAEQLGKREEEEERTRLQREKEEEEARDQLEREESMRLEKKKKEEREKREQEEKDRIEREEKEMKEREEMKRVEREKQLEKERIERETREKEEKEKLEKEKLEKERQKQEEMDRLAKEKRDREEKERLEKEMREEKKSQEKEIEQKKNEEESKDNKEGVEKEKRQAPGKRKAGPGRRGGNSKKEEEQELEKGTKESLESEIPQLECEEGSSKKQEDDQAESEAKPRRGRRTTGKSIAPPADMEDEGGPAKRTRSRSNSSNSVCSERSTQDSLTEGRRRGGRRKTTEETNEPARTSGRSKTFAAPCSEKEDIKQASQSRSNSRSSDRSSSTIATQRQGRGEKRRKGMKAEESEKAGEKEEEVEQLAAVGRGRGRKGRKSIKVEEPEVAEEKEVEQSAAVGRGRGGKGRKSLKVEEPEVVEEEEVEQLAAVGRGRGGKGRKSIKVEEPEVTEEKEEEVEQSPAAGRGRGRGRGGKRPGVTAIKAEATGEAEKEETEVMSVSEDSVSSQSSSRGRKRGADVSILAAEAPQPTPKTPRRSLGRQTHKVLFTGVMDEDGEKVVVRLGGGMAKGVNDMTHLVTDKVRRTVKFLCAVARGVPIVTPDWLTKCGKAGSFLSPNGFLVKDVEQEKRFNFTLQEALRVASSQPLLQGYEIHVTPSVKPEPAQMKEIVACCGARFLPKIPSAHKAQTVVVSCEEDRALCERARTLSLPVVSAEFLLTGILQQRVDVQAHALSLSPTAAVSEPAARSRGK